MANGILKVSNIQTSSGSGTITLGQSGETVTVPSGATLDMTNATMSLNSDMKNTPAFQVELSANVTGITDNVSTKIPFDTINFDTHNAFDTTNNRFVCPSNGEGKYLFSGFSRTDSITSNNLAQAKMHFYKNGAQEKLFYDLYNTNYLRAKHIAYSLMLDLVAGDYVELYRQDNLISGTTTLNSVQYSEFNGFRIIGA